mmetsp:Transcript_9631/g.20584  ORF Transcript_9631/g.20584 Transcript_9631/m.20584 type:complete len:101 (-) Transcript_9631:466-768(-)
MACKTLCSSVLRDRISPSSKFVAAVACKSASAVGKARLNGKGSESGSAQIKQGSKLNKMLGVSLPGVTFLWNTLGQRYRIKRPPLPMNSSSYWRNEKFRH